jgi:hypothetical protein
MDVTEFDIQTQITPCLVHNEGAQSGDDAIRVLSNDGLVVIDLTVLFRVSPEAPKKFKRNWRKLQ